MAEEQQEDFSKLDIEDRLKHKNWSARVSAFDELIKEFSQADPDDAVFKKHANFVKNFSQDANAAALEKGLEATLAFVENVNPTLAGRICSDVVAGLISKCFTARPKAKEKSYEIILIFFEIEKQDLTTEELLKGLDHKSPKVVSGCSAVMRDALRFYGIKALSVKAVLPKVLPLLDDRDKSVREEARALLVEIHRWVGDVLKPKLADLKPAQLSELEAEFVKHKGVKPVSERLFRSEQVKKAQQAAEPSGEANLGGGGDAKEEEPVIDPADLFEPVDILKALPDEFEEKLTSKKWQDRKDILELLDKISNEPKLAEGDYNELVSNLKKIVGKDSNVVVVALAGKCLVNIAKGLKGDKKFQTYFQPCISVIIEKFKEKKSNVVTSMRESIDACGLPLSLDVLTEDVIAASTHKTPSVKSETVSFLARRFAKCYPEDLTKKQLKVFVEALITNSTDPDPAVRDAAFEALGTAKKVVGEKVMTPFLGDLDQIKLDKIKEYCDKVEINLPKRKVPAPVNNGKAEQPTKAVKESAAPVKKVVRPGTKPKTLSAPSQEKTEDVELKLEVTQASVPGDKAKKVGHAPPVTSKAKPKEEESGPLITVNPQGKKQRINDEKLLKILKWNFQSPTKEFEQQLKDQMTPYFSSMLLTQLFSSDFKNQTKAIESLQNDLGVNSEATISVLDLILKWFTLRFFENNSTFLGKGLEYLQTLFKKLAEESYNLTEMEVCSFVPYLLLKIGDPKDVFRNHVKAIIRQLCFLTPYSKIYSFLADGMKAKNSRQRTECILMATWTMDSYGLEACFPSQQVALKNIGQQIGDRDQTVRNAALDNLALAYQLMNGDKEKLYKMIAPMNDKDRSMLDERLKRTSVPQKVDVAKKPESKPALRKTTVIRVSANQNINNPSAGDDEPESDIGSVQDEGKNGRTSFPSSSSSEVSEKNAPVVPERPPSGIQRPGTVTLRRTAPQLMPIAPEQMALAMENVPIPSRTTGISSSKAATGTLATLFTALSSGNPESILNALEKIDEIVSDEKSASLLSDNLLELYRRMSDLLRRLHASFMSNYATNYTYICNCYACALHILRLLFENPTYADQASASVLSDLLHNLISVLLDKRMETMNGGEDIVRNVNVITLRIVDNANRTQIICASVRLLRELLGSGVLTDKFLDLVIKCVWRAVRKMPDTVLQLNVDPILLEIHLFLKQFPAAHWQSASDETPFRTVKTIVYTLTKMFRADVLNHMSLIDDPQSSELISFLKRVLRAVESENGDSSSAKNANSNVAARNGSTNTHEETLSNIINKIGSADNQIVQKGLKELYDYKEAHNINLDEFLERTSIDFQKFVQENLRLIEFEQKALGLPNHGLSEKGQGIISRLRGVLSSPFITSQDIENIRLMAADVKLQIRNECFKTATQRVEAAIHAVEANAYMNEENMESPRRPNVMTPSRPLKSMDENTTKSTNLEDVKARVKAYLMNKGSL